MNKHRKSQTPTGASAQLYVNLICGFCESALCSNLMPCMREGIWRNLLTQGTRIITKISTITWKQLNPLKLKLLISRSCTFNFYSNLQEVQSNTYDASTSVYTKTREIILKSQSSSLGLSFTCLNLAWGLARTLPISPAFGFPYTAKSGEKKLPLIFP